MENKNWFDVKKVLPKYGEVVLLWLGSKRIAIGSLDYTDKNGQHYKYVSDYDTSGDSVDILFWMYMPECATKNLTSNKADNGSEK